MIDLLTSYWPFFLEGFTNTLLASAIALIASLLIGSVMAILQLADQPMVKFLANCYVEFFRNIPLLVIVMFFFIAVPLIGWPLSNFQAGTIGLTLYTSAFIADNVRAGILTIPKGQMEAGLASGLTKSQTMKDIILPQAIRVIIPPLGNQFINLVKNSSILAMVGGLDLMYYGDYVSMETFETIATYVLVGCLYLLITLPITRLVRYLEAKLAYH
ncbi:amino acid ABC transporter permease [Hutsoniella sourekii]